MTLLLAALDNAYRHFARAADAFLQTFSPLTYERGDALMAFEEENEVHEPPAGKLSCEVCKGLVSPEWLANSCNGKCEVVNRFGLSITSEAFADLGQRLDAVTAAERATFDSPVGVSTSPPTVPPTGLDPSPTIIESAPPPPVGGDGPSEEIAAFPRRPSEGQPTVPAGSAPDLPAGISLPMFRASDLIAIAVSYGMDHTYMESMISTGTPYCSCGPVMATYLDWWKHVAEIQVSAITAELTALAYDQSQPPTLAEAFSRVCTCGDNVIHHVKNKYSCELRSCGCTWFTPRNQTEQ